jgi:hypothetical protein
VARGDLESGDRWLLGVIFAVITFWLFAQTLLNVIPAIQASLGLNSTVAKFAVSVPCASAAGSARGSTSSCASSP